MTRYGAESMLKRPHSTNAFHRYIAEAEKYYRVASFEEATRALDLAEAQELSTTISDKVYIAKRRGEIERRKGNNDLAIAHLLTGIALNNDTTNLEHVELIGELGVVYLNKDEYDNAQEQFVDQHRMAETLIGRADDWPTKAAAQAQACRAIGNLGLSKLQYALAMPTEAKKVMYKHAIMYLERRVTLARNLLQDLEVKGDPGNHKAIVFMWQSLGLDRLALCYTAIGDHQRAIAYGEASIQMTDGSFDPSTRALSRFYYGNALLAAGRGEDAKLQWNPENDLCTPAIALCKEPSDESCRSLRKLRTLAVGFDRYDEHGYSALDYAVLAGHDKCASIVMRGLRDELDLLHPNDEAEVERQVDLRKAEARRRKHYREIFQTTFRPCLNRRSSDVASENRIDELRQRYANELRCDLRKRQVFDTFNFLSYSSFKALGRLPKPKDDADMENLRRQTREDPVEHTRSSDKPPYVIFFSYEWLGKNDGHPEEPDDGGNTQYKRMINAIEDILKRPNEVTGIPDLMESRIFIWLDVASIDQVNQEPGAQDRGISALPLVITLCNMMISLVDETYFTRAWCSVEVLMMQRLLSYGDHRYLEHTLTGTDTVQGTLTARDRLDDVRNVASNDAKYGITKDEDRASIRFLVKQSELLQKPDSDYA